MMLQLTTTRKNVVQPRLEIGRPDDKYEKEADAVADRVMRMPSSENLQMKVAGPGPDIQMKCAQCEEEEKLQMKAVDNTGNMLRMKHTGGEGKMMAPEGVTRQLKNPSGSGSPLPKSVQKEMGSKMGADFSRVKVHTDNTAVQLSQNLGARAFTVGNDIYFNKGQYSPDSGNGKRLMVHELVHTVQQRKANLRSIVQLQEWLEPKKQILDFKVKKENKNIIGSAAAGGSIQVARVHYQAAVRDAKEKASRIAIDAVNEFTFDIIDAIADFHIYAKNGISQIETGTKADEFAKMLFSGVMIALGGPSLNIAGQVGSWILDQIKTKLWEEVNKTVDKSVDVENLHMIVDRLSQSFRNAANSIRNEVGQQLEPYFKEESFMSEIYMADDNVVTHTLTKIGIPDKNKDYYGPVYHQLVKQFEIAKWEATHSDLYKSMHNVFAGPVRGMTSNELAAKKAKEETAKQLDKRE